jgi:hypothetical protein
MSKSVLPSKTFLAVFKFVRVLSVSILKLHQFIITKIIYNSPHFQHTFGIYTPTVNADTLTLDCSSVRLSAHRMTHSGSQGWWTSSVSQWHHYSTGLEMGLYAPYRVPAFFSNLLIKGSCKNEFTRLNSTNFFFFGATAPIWALAYLHETLRFTSVF